MAWAGFVLLTVPFLRVQARPIIYCFPFCGVFVCMHVCSSVVASPPMKNVTDSVQVLLWVVLLTLWLSLMHTNFIICQ